MPTIAIFAPELSGETGLTLELRVASSGVLTNTGGDTLTESPASSGRFEATVAEAISVLHYATVKSGSLTLRDGWLAASETLVVDSHPYDVPTVAEFEARTLATANYATSSAQTSLSSAISAIAVIFTGMTSLPNWLRRAFRKDAGTVGMGTAETEIQTGGTATYVGTTDNLEAIKDAGGGGGGGGSGDASQATLLEVQADVNSLLGLSGSGSMLPSGYVSGLTEPLVIGDDYTSDVGRLITISLVDAAGDPAATTFGAKSLADAGISIQLLLKPSGVSTGSAAIYAACTFVPAPDVDTPASLTVSLSKTQTVLAAPGKYDLQVEAKWTDTSTVTFLPFGKVTFVKDIRRTA